MLLQGRKQPLEHASFGPTPQAGVNSVPVFEPGRQGSPLVAASCEVEHGIDYRQVADPHVPVLYRQIAVDQLILYFAYLINFKLIIYMPSAG